MPKGGHNRKSVEELKKNGGYRATRHRNRVDNEPAAGLPEMPKGFTQAQKKLWDRVIQQLPDSLIGELDTNALEEFCRVTVLMQKARRQLEKNPVDRQAQICWTGYFDRWLKFTREFGATPLARSGLKMPPKEEKSDDPVESLVARYAG